LLRLKLAGKHKTEESMDAAVVKHFEFLGMVIVVLLMFACITLYNCQHFLKILVQDNVAIVDARKRS
jgi:hypothetical protein